MCGVGESRRGPEGVFVPLLGWIMAVFTGTDGNDTLIGTADPDSFYPQWGQDVVDGLGGSDTLVVDYTFFFADPFGGAAVPTPMASVITSNGGSFGGTVRTTYGGYSVALSNIEHLHLYLNNFGDSVTLNGSALALGATIHLNGGGGWDRLDADLSALAAVSLTTDAAGSIAGFGTIVGFEELRLNLTAGDDHVVTGASWDVVNGNGGNDLLDGGAGGDRLEGDSGDDRLYGASGSDSLYGEDGNDQLFGGDDSDWLAIGTGLDTADGGAGADTLVVQWGDWTRSIRTQALTLGASGYSGVYAEDFGPVERSVQFSMIERFEITTGSGNDIITIGNGNDIVSTGDGNDIVDVGSGDDRADGGAGEDRISADFGAATTPVIYNLATGFYSGPNFSFFGPSFSNFEGFGLFRTGSGDDDLVTTALQFNETIEVGAGNDKVTVSRGQDLVAGGAGTDLLVVDYSATTGTLQSQHSQNLPWGTLATGYNGRIYDAFRATWVDYSGIERFDINAANSAFVDIETGGGDDRIVSGSGWDRIAPGGGNDHVDAGAGILDTIDYSQRKIPREEGTVGVIVNLSATSYVIHSGHLLAGETVAPSEAIDNWGDRDTILGFENAESGEQDDVLLGSAVQNHFYGWGGNDRIVGGGGSDHLDAGGGVDLVDYSAETGTSGVIVNIHEAVVVAVPGLPFGLAPGEALDSFGNKDRLFSFEQVTTGGHNDRVYGSSFDNLIALGAGDDEGFGFHGNDRIIGAAGADKLFGGFGNDRLEGGEDSDALNGEGGDDSMAGGSGDDVYWVDSPGDGVLENIGEGTDEIRTTLASYSLAGLANVENLTATDSAAHDFEGNGGDNLLTGGGGNDVLRGGTGTNSVDGGEGDDLVRSVGFGVDFIEGGAGNDVAEIDWSAQALAFSTVASGDVAFGNFVDTAATLTGIERVIIATGSGADAITTLGGNDEIRTGAGDDYLNGAGGDDFLDGGAGSDAMTGGLGDDIYLVDEFGDSIVENSGEGTDEVRTGLASYMLGASVENLTGTAAAGQVLTGNGLDNVIRSGSFGDRIRLEGGGDDSAFAGAGTDSVFFGAALTMADAADGGADRDQLSIQGDYRTVPLVLGSGVVNFESFLLLSGTDTRFGDDGTHSYSYAVISHDANVAAGQVMVVDGAQLKVGENFTFDGSAETNGAFRLWGGMGIEDLTGGAMSDQFYFSSGRFGADDKVDGGGSRDQLGLRGDYTLAFGADQITSIESLLLLSGRGVRDDTDYDYDLTMDDLNLAGGVLMTVDAGQLTAGEHLTFDGSAETDGSFRIFGGAGADSLTGSSNGDILFGALGKDYLKGGAGADAYSYRSAADSTSTGYDTIDGFEFGVDTLDLPGVHDSYGHTAGSVSTATFDADLAAATVGMLGSSALFVDVVGGDLAGKLFLVIDQNGILGYQAGEDFVIELANTIVPPPPIPNFIV